MSSPNLKIEQVEMIRRLRNSGVTVPQIIEAYQVFERTDKEFGSFGDVKVTSLSDQPSSHSASHMTSAIQPSSTSNSCQRFTNLISDCYQPNRNITTLTMSANNSVTQSPLHVKSLLNNHSRTGQIKQGHLNQSTSFSNVLKEVAISTSSSLSRDSVGGDGSFLGVNNFNDGSSIKRPLNHEQYMASVSHESMANQNTNEHTETHLHSITSPDFPFGEKLEFSHNSDSALREAGRCMLLSATSDQIVTLVRKCSVYMPADFNPYQLVPLYGLSEKEVEEFQCGHIPQEGDFRLQVVDWFVNILIKTDWFLNEVLKFSQQLIMPKKTELPDVDFTPRRERFTFRDSHLEVLEANFKKSLYPSLKEKEMIANECNIKMAMAINAELKEKERVTHINVDHWFRNKRKEMIRRAKMEKLDATLSEKLKQPPGRLFESKPSINNNSFQPGPIAFPSSTPSIESDHSASPQDNGVIQMHSQSQALVMQVLDPNIIDSVPQRKDSLDQDESSSLPDDGTRVEIKTEPVAED